MRRLRVISTGMVCPDPCEFCGTLADSTSVLSSSAQKIDAALEMVQPGDRLVFTGGGLTDLDMLPDWVAKAKHAGAKQVVIQSDGSAFAYDGYVRALREAGVDVFAVPLHGPIAPLHEWVNQTSGSFMQTIRGIQNIRKSGGTVMINSVLVRSNFRHIGELITLGGKLGVRIVRLLWPFQSGVPERDLLSVTPVPDVVRPYISGAEEHAIRVGLRLHVELPEADELETPAQLSETV